MLRLKLSGDITNDLYFELAYEATPTWSDSFLRDTQMDNSFRVADLDRLLYPSSLEADDKFMITQNLDRAFVSLKEDSFDLIAGRQPISFGSAHVINPTDILAPFALATLAKEEKIGIDALRVRIVTGDFSEIDMAVVLKDEARQDESAAYLRIKNYIFEADITFMLMRYGDNSMVGIDMARAIGQTSAWLEATYTKPKDETFYTDSSNYTRLSVGADMAFTPAIYGYLEYHYNGAGAESAEDYLLNTQKAAYLEGSVYLLGKNYLAPGINLQVTPLINAEATAVINLDDGSSMFAPSVTMSVSDNSTASVGAYMGLGEKPDIFGIPRSEFGSYPDTYYLSFKYYF